MVARSEDVVSAIAKTNGWRAEETTKALQYHAAFRKEANTELRSASIIELQEIELESSASVKGAGIFAQILQGTGIAGMVGSALGVSATIVDEYNKNNQRAQAEGFLEIVPEGDLSDCGKFTKELGAKFTESKIDQIQNLSKKEIQEMAKRDAYEALNFMHIENVGRAESDKLTIYSDNIESIVASRVVGEQSSKQSTHHEHLDLGKFTHAAIANEHKHTTQIQH